MFASDVPDAILKGEFDEMLDKLAQYITLRRQSIAAWNVTRMTVGTKVRVLDGCRNRELRGCTGTVTEARGKGKVVVVLDRPPLHKWIGNIRFPADLLEVL